MGHKNDIPKRISEIRTIAKISQTELARRMELSPSLIHYWETGDRKPSPEQLQEIARHLGVSLDYLLKEKKQPAFQYRAKVEVPEPALFAKVQLDASAQVEYLDEIFRLAARPMPHFMHMAEFSYAHLDHLTDQLRNNFRLHRRISLPALKQAMTEQGIFVFEWAMPDYISGMSYRGAVSAVFINSLHQPTRRLFTLAHELGHLLFHLGRGNEETSLVSYGNNQDPQEKEANAFASELLMPFADITALAERHGDLILDVSMMEAIARSFNVSRDALFFSLVKMKLLTREDRPRYANAFEPANPGEHRVTDITTQVTPLLIEPALSLYLGGKSTSQQLTDWFYVDPAKTETYLASLKIVKNPTP